MDNRQLLTADVWIKERIVSRERLIRSKEQDIERIQREIDEAVTEIKFYEAELGRYNSGKRDR